MTKPARNRSVVANANNEQQLPEPHDEQLKVVERSVQRELLRAGVFAGPLRDDWTLDDAFPLPDGDPPEGCKPLRFAALVTKIDPNESCSASTAAEPGRSVDDSETAVREIAGRAAAVLGAALLVRDAHARAHGPIREVRDLMRRLAALLQEIKTFLNGNSEALIDLLRNLGLTDGFTSADKQLNHLGFREQYGLLALIDKNAVPLAEAASKLERSLDELVLDGTAAHQTRRQGPKMHYTALLAYLGLKVREIAEVQEELPEPDEFDDDATWEDAMHAAERAAGERVARAKRLVSAPQPTREGNSRVGIERRAVVLMCRYVQPRQPVSIRFGSS